MTYLAILPLLRCGYPIKNLSSESNTILVFNSSCNLDVSAVENNLGGVRLSKLGFNPDKPIVMRSGILQLDPVNNTITPGYEFDVNEIIEDNWAVMLPNGFLEDFNSWIVGDKIKNMVTNEFGTITSIEGNKITAINNTTGDVMNSFINLLFSGGWVKDYSKIN